MYEGVQYVVFGDGKCAKLSNARTLLPQVQLQVSPQSEIMKVATELIKGRDIFWIHFSDWVLNRVDTYMENGGDGLRIFRTLLPNIQEVADYTFDQL